MDEIFIKFKSKLVKVNLIIFTSVYYFAFVVSLLCSSVVISLLINYICANDL
jgi:hypothetical protein